MRDNKTSQPAQEYDGNVRKTLPFYDCFHESALSLLEVARPRAARWLDTGGGTGTLIEKAAGSFAGTAFTLADPSAPMVDIAKKKLAGLDCAYIVASTEELAYPEERFDVITAIMAHHYLDADDRRKATANCLRMLKPGGVYVTFEHIMPAGEQGLRIGLEWWRRAQIRQGKDEESAAKHMKRFGVEYFPVTIAAHLQLLRDTGFSAAEILWASGMQAGFYAIK